MAREISQRQQQVYDFVRNYLMENGYPPTVREIGESVNVKSTSLVAYYLDRLVERGLITRDPSVSRGIRLVGEATPSADTLSVPFLGYIVASVPLPVEPLSGEETIEINRALFGRDLDHLFALRVRGNSMIDALVSDGDTIILRQQERVENGEMAAVWIDGAVGETSLKKVYYEDQRVRLQPANPTMAPIYVSPSALRVQGKVVLVIRNLN